MLDDDQTFDPKPCTVDDCGAVGAVTTLLGGNASEAPTRPPVGQWAWWVTAADLDHDDVPALLQGCWFEREPAAGRREGDLVVRLIPPADLRDGDRATVEVEMLLAYAGRWSRVAWWPRLGGDWPQVVTPTAAAVMGLWADAAESAHLTGSGVS